MMDRKSFFFPIILFCSFCIDAQKIVVTGGAGFIGSHLVAALLKRGDCIVIIDNFNGTSPISIQQKNVDHIIENDVDNRVTIYKEDVCDAQAMQTIFEKENPDIICHLAARTGVRQSTKEPYHYLHTNIIGTCVMFEMARQFNIKHIVYASSSSVYGLRRDLDSFKEDDPVNEQLSIYGMTKRADELLAYVYHYLFGISITSLRFFTVYGPRGRIDMAPFIFMHAISNDNALTVYGDGSAVRDFTYISDIIDGIIKAIDTPLGYEIINLGRGEPQLLADFIATLETIIGKQAKITYTQEFSGDVPRTCADIHKAQKLLNYNPQISIQMGLYLMYEWYKNELDISLYPKKRTVFFQGGE